MNQDRLALEIGIFFPGHTHEKVTGRLGKNTGRTATAAEVDLALAQCRKQSGSRGEGAPDDVYPKGTKAILKQLKPPQLLHKGHALWIADLELAQAAGLLRQGRRGTLVGATPPNAIEQIETHQSTTKKQDVLEQNGRGARRIGQAALGYRFPRSGRLGTGRRVRAGDQGHQQGHEGG